MVVYWWASPLLSDFGGNFVHFWGQISTFFGQKQGLNVNFNYFNPKGLNLAWFRAFWYTVRKDPFRGLTCRLGEEKKVYIKRMIVKKRISPRRPTWTDLHQIWHNGSTRRPNHPWHFLAIGLGVLNLWGIGIFLSPRGRR